MHRHLRRFQIQKRRVHRRQLLGVRHNFPPAVENAAPWRRFWRLECLCYWSISENLSPSCINCRAGPFGIMPLA
jgi:hypothetical protein